MSLIVKKPHNGSITHLFDSDEAKNKTPYVKDSPNGSVCGRAPYPYYGKEKTIADLTCWRCKRAYEILSKYIVPTAPAGKRGTQPVQAKSTHSKRGNRK